MHTADHQLHVFMSEQSPEEHDRFLQISREYAEAVEAYDAIFKQATTLAALGAGAQLETFIADFLRMATGAREHAREAGFQNFTDWFDEMIRKMRELRGQLGAGE